MIERHHSDGRRKSTALYSDCERYRYALTRTWDETAPRLLFVMLNPSKATEAENDPTIERCERRAAMLGYGAFRAVNIFAWRDTDPARMKRASDPIGQDNDDILRDSAGTWLRGPKDRLLCGWGTHGAHLGRGIRAAALLAETGHALYCFGTTLSGEPRHPLYIGYATQPLVWTGPVNR